MTFYAKCTTNENLTLAEEYRKSSASPSLSRGGQDAREDVSASTAATPISQTQTLNNSGYLEPEKTLINILLLMKSI